MYIKDKDGLEIWQDEQTTYEIKDNDGNIIRTVEAIKKEYHIEATEGGITYTPADTVTEQWKAINQPIIIPNPKDLIIEELKQLDIVLPRVAEDIIYSTVIDLTTLPIIVQERLARKVELRSQLKELG